MKIDDTPRRLTIDAASWLTSSVFALCILLALFFGIGALRAGSGEGWWLIFIAAFLSLFLLAFTERCQLILDRDLGEMIHRRRTFAGLVETRRPLRDVHRAEIAESRSGDGSTRRMEVLVGGERIPFRHVKRGSRSPMAAAEAVNRWLDAG